MEEGRPYTLGVIGLGEGRSIISAAQTSEHWDLVKVCDLSEDLCRERAEEFGLSSWTTDYEDLLADPSIQVIAIYTPDQVHGAHIVAALDAGKDVICTKPLLASLSEAKSVIGAQRRSGRRLFVGQSSRFFEPMIRQRGDFEAGKIGELATVEAHYITDARWFLSRAWAKKPGFSWMYNFMIHAVDLARWYCPDMVEVMGYGKLGLNARNAGSSAPDSLRFLAIDKAGTVCQISGSYASMTLGRDVEPSISCTLRGSSGASRSSYPRLRYWTHFEGEGGDRAYSFDEKQGYYFRFERESHHAGEYQNYIDYFASCLDSGRTALPDLAEGIGTLAVMAALDRSLETGQPCKVSSILEEYGLQGIAR